MNAAARILLVVEDDPDIREGLAEVLAAVGYRVEQAPNGCEAIRKLERMAELPSAIVLDLMMPVMNGWEFRRAQLADPRISEIPVVVISASGSAQSVPAEAHLEKPFEIGSFLRAIRSVLTARSGRAAESPAGDYT